MPTGGRGSVTESAARAKPAKRAGAKTSAGVAPIYKRLPHGPHRLPRGEVIRHQRTRIHGAMVEAVSRSGYERTSVKQVIGLAGVSRRSFYEQFDNKQECFLATFDLLVGRGLRGMARAYVRSEGGLRERLGASFESFASEVAQSPKAASLVLLDAQTAGAAGTLRMRRATASCERMLAQGFAEAPDAHPLPAPIVRGIVGGLHGAVGQALRSGGEHTQAERLSESMLSWTAELQTSRGERLGQLLSARANQRMREISLASAHPHDGERRQSLRGDVRTRVLHEALRLGALYEYRELTAPQIADEACLPIDAFLELFASRDECYLAALDMIGEELLAIAADPDLVSENWPAAVRRVLWNLLGHLGERPLYSRTIAQEAFSAGEAAVRRMLDLAAEVATLLTEGAPVRPHSPLAVDCIAGALLHTVRCQVASGRTQLLGALSDHLSYLVLAPFLGADAACDALEDDPRPASAAGG